MHRTGALGLVLLAAACGGEALGADARREADAACGLAAVALEQVAWPDDSELSLLSVAPAVAATAEIQQGLLDRLAALSTETPEDTGLDDLVRAGRPLVAGLERMEAASTAGDVDAFDAALAEVTASTEQASAVSERLGLESCYATAGV